MCVCVCVCVCVRGEGVIKEGRRVRGREREGWMVRKVQLERCVCAGARTGTTSKSIQLQCLARLFSAHA